MASVHSSPSASAADAAAGLSRSRDMLRKTFAPSLLRDAAPWSQPKRTARLVLASGAVIEGIGIGAEGHAVGEVCFNTAITGYQEILTDPSYQGQIVTFTFPHIGNVGVNAEDTETANSAKRAGASGVVLKSVITDPSNYRAVEHLDHWLKARGIIGIAGVDTRALTGFIRDNGMPNAVIAHSRAGKFDIPALKAEAQAWSGLDGLDLVPHVTRGQTDHWREGLWVWDKGYQGDAVAGRGNTHKIVAIDYGLKSNILRCLVSAGCEVTVVPATTSAEDILARKPEGVLLSNGPGDPAATGRYAVPTIQALVKAGIPIFGICLGHQMLALALGAKTHKMHQGHHGANHPVKDITTGKVEITSMNHGFAVDRATLPQGVVETHVSLFDGSNCGIAVSHKPIFSVQYHPEASPGPADSHYLFERFVQALRV
jgi:carbamoyl-phosphate synthase small subunit